MVQVDLGQDQELQIFRKQLIIQFQIHFRQGNKAIIKPLVRVSLVEGELFPQGKEELINKQQSLILQHRELRIQLRVLANIT